MIIHTDLFMAMAQHFNACRRHQREEGLVGPNKFEIIETRLHRFRIRHAIEEVEGAPDQTGSTQAAPRKDPFWKGFMNNLKEWLENDEDIE